MFAFLPQMAIHLIGVGDGFRSPKLGLSSKSSHQHHDVTDAIIKHKDLAIFQVLHRPGSESMPLLHVCFLSHLKLIQVKRLQFYFKFFQFI